MLSKPLHPNQHAAATVMGLTATEFETVEAAINAIEAKLGERAMQVRSKWFVISVLRFQQKKKWADLDACGLDEARQNELAQQCLAVTGFAASLKTVTKDHRSRFRFVGFASSKNLERGVLAKGTKAFKIASAVLSEAGLASQQAAPPQEKKQEQKLEQKQKVATVATVESAEAEKTVVARRAQRRGFSAGQPTPAPAALRQTSEPNQSLTMSEEEFADLDAALNQPDIEVKQQSWGDQGREDRISRALGVLAGLGFFVFVALLFL